MREKKELISVSIKIICIIFNINFIIFIFFLLLNTIIAFLFFWKHGPNLFISFLK